LLYPNCENSRAMLEEAKESFNCSKVSNAFISEESTFIGHPYVLNSGIVFFTSISTIELSFYQQKANNFLVVKTPLFLNT
jgi:hypothetical protein